MSNQYSLKQTDFNATTGKGIADIIKKASIYGMEAIKAVALVIKHLFSTFLGK